MSKESYILEGIHSYRSCAHGDFKVEFEDKASFTVENEIVEYVLNLVENSISGAEVALLLAYLEYAKKENKKHTNRYTNDSIKEQTLINVTAELVNSYSLEEIIQYFREMKWHEIVNIYNSADPILELVGEEPPYQGEDDD